jgi:hypothetical protein
MQQWQNPKIVHSELTLRLSSTMYELHLTIMAASGVCFDWQVCWYCHVVTFFSSIVVLTANGDFRVVPLLHSVTCMAVVSLTFRPPYSLWMPSRCALNKAERAPDPVWTLWRREKKISFAVPGVESRFLGRLVHIPVTTEYCSCFRL